MLLFRLQPPYGLIRPVWFVWAYRTLSRSTQTGLTHMVGPDEGKALAVCTKSPTAGTQKKGPCRHPRVRVHLVVFICAVCFRLGAGAATVGCWHHERTDVWRRSFLGTNVNLRPAVASLEVTEQSPTPTPAPRRRRHRRGQGRSQPCTIACVVI